MKSGVIAIVGRPNVGKSTIFNRIAGARVSIVEDIPGVTRDRIYATGEWTGNHFELIDTGGIQLEGQPYQEEILAQVQIAIQEADVIIMVCDGKGGMSDDDRYIAGIAVSGVHGLGVGDVLDACIEKLPEEDENHKEEGIRIAVIGQPNVGKSSLVNRILREDRSIVSNEQGTTRDAVDTKFIFDGRPYVIVDTAGIRKRGKVYESVEKYSVLRAMSAIEHCDVALFLIDAEKGIREQDKHVAGYAAEAGKPIVIVVNKWDTVEKDDKTMLRYTEKVRAEFAYLSYAPVVYVSAKSGQRVDTIIPMVDRVYENANRRIATNILNEVIADTQVTTPAPARNGKRFRVYYATQVASAPPTFVLSCNDPKLMHFSYQRFLENSLRQAFDFEGTPIKVIARRKISE